MQFVESQNQMMMFKKNISNINKGDIYKMYVGITKYRQRSCLTLTQIAF